MPDDKWFDSLPDTLTIEHNGAQVPLKSHPFVQEAPDLATFARRSFDTHRELGSRIPLKVTDDASRAAWRKEHLPKFYQAGVLSAPAETPEGYFIKPEKLPDGLAWNDAFAKEIGTALHKHGVPASAGPALLEIWHNTQQKDLKTAVEGMKAELGTVTTTLKEKYKEQFDNRLESARRLAKQTMANGEMMEQDPDLLPVFMALAPLAEQDSSFLKDVIVPSSSNAKSAEASWQEYNAIIQNKDNPKHKLYWDGDKATIEYVQALATKAFPGERTL